MKLYRQNTYDAPTYRAAYAAWYTALPIAQQAAVYDYTDSGYRSLNHCLRHGKVLSEHDAGMMEHLDAALAAHPGADAPRRLFRAVRQLPAVPVADEVLRAGHYLSTTSDPHQLFKFTTADEPIIFEIHAHVGVPVSDIHDEYEFLLPRGTNFRVGEVQHGIDWHAEYEGTDYSRALHGATVITLTQE